MPIVRIPGVGATVVVTGGDADIYVDQHGRLADELAVTAAYTWVEV